ncbi:MAG: hypothetical protein R2734_00355 [Nocardioides sp.]
MQESFLEVRRKDDFDVEGPLPAKNIDTGLGLERVAYPSCRARTTCTRSTRCSS